jgi:N-acetylglucosamine kinase-like BadF-type ATPase
VSNKRLFLGVDGGGSKTAALLVDETGEVLGAGMGGPANYHVNGLDGMLRSVRQAVDGALGGQKPDEAAFCLASADMPHDFRQIYGKLPELELSCPFTVYADVMAVFRAGSRFAYGVGMVCGTGFNGGGLAKDGREFRFPSLGLVTGDKGGGGDLGYAAIGAAFRAWDGRGEPTMLQEAILQALDAPDMETLAERWVQRKLTGHHVRDLSPLVFEIAERGDAVARQLIRDQGVEMGVAAVAVLRKLDLTNEDCDVALGGSLWYGQGSLLIDTVKEVVHQAAPRARVKRLDVPPVVGAVLLAADKHGVTLDGSRLRATLPEAFQVPVTTE